MHGLQLLHQNAQEHLTSLPKYTVRTTSGDVAVHGNSQSHAEQRAKSMGYKLIKQPMSKETNQEKQVRDSMCDYWYEKGKQDTAREIVEWAENNGATGVDLQDRRWVELNDLKALVKQKYGVED